jgi:hypothetical protein
VYFFFLLIHITRSLVTYKQQRQQYYPGTLDSTRKILRCPSCWAQFEEKKGDADDKTKTNKHEPGCTLRVLLELYDTHIDKNLTEVCVCYLNLLTLTNNNNNINNRYMRKSARTTMRQL